MDTTRKQEQLHVCFDRMLPPEKYYDARLAAIDENPVNYAPLVRGGAESKKLWLPGRTLRVRFMDGDPVVQQKVADIFPEWSQYANLHFVQSHDDNAEIRISFQSAGSWSYIGTDALVVPTDRPTMNFGWLKRTSNSLEYKACCFT
ncbi:hypothetical protein KFU94_15715 [Chloroflexi bacterium TSY]|nr:hypothetical protein [Chloroflexi bacterium TSY]